MLIDTHIHLDAAEFDDDREQVLAAARAAGIGGFVVPGVDERNWSNVAALSCAHADVFPAYGIHPLFVKPDCDAALEVLATRLAAPETVALGEVGLDYFVEEYDAVLQERILTEQLRLAQHVGLPVILHVRHAVDAVLRQLRRIEVPGGIAHAFNGSRQQADIFIDMGFKLGFGGAMTYSGSRRIRRLAATLPLEALVLETDAPDMPPAWAPFVRNIPVNLVRYAAELAALRGMSVDELAQATGENVRAALPRLRQAERAA